MVAWLIILALMHYVSCFQSQAKVLAEQKRFPFSTIDTNTNEELGRHCTLIFYISEFEDG